MGEENRPSKIMVTCAGRIPSLELGAIVPLSELQKQGLCEFRYKDEMFLSPTDISWCDILFIVRGADSESVWAARWAKQHGRIVLGYWDDDLLGIPDYSSAYRYYANFKIRANIDTLFRLADAFLSPNSKLAAKLTVLHGKEVRLLPGVHGTERFEPPKKRIARLPIVGYSGGPDHIRILNSFIGPAIGELAQTGANFKLHIVGPKPDFLAKLPVETRYTPSIPDYYEYLAFASKLEWDIGLAPQWDSEFTTCKFYNKLLEYAHIGCAGIYTKIEPYFGVIEDGVTGLLVPNEVGAWRDAILRLLKNPELRFKIASNAYEFAQSHHNRKVVAEQYKQTLAPFLGYRAPTVGRPYLIASDLAGGPGRLWRIGTEYIKVHGLWYVLRRAPPYLFRLLRQRLRV
jgi:glycosyltransferase involved in cell wall biosynthesis